MYIQDVKQLAQYAPLRCLDAVSNVFFQRELEHIIAETFEFEYANNVVARDVFPVYTGAGPGDEAITWQQYTSVGHAHIVADYAQDINVVNLSGEEFTTPVRTIALATQWSIQELAAAAQYNKPLDRMAVMSLRKEMLRRENRIAFSGDAAFGLTGLASAGTGIPQNAAPTGTWASATADQIIADMNFCANTVPEVTGDVERPNTILLALSRYNQIASTPRSATSDTTILQYFLQNNPYINEVVPVLELEDAFASAPVMIAYDKSPDKLRLNVPLDIQSLPPQEVNMVVKVIYRMRTGGLTIHKPASLHVVTGI